MNIDDIALVRATDAIPFDGIVKSLSNVCYLNKELGNFFSNIISDLLEKHDLTPKYDFSKVFEDEDYYDNYVKKKCEIVKEYLPYSSDYNSIVLFSTNGLCPDDSENGFGNNTFSNKKCAIIEPLKPHIEQVISLCPTDTALKGDVNLSHEAIILIEEDTLNNLTNEEKSMLYSLNLTIRSFKGSLKTAVFETINSSSKYIAETLTLSSAMGGIMPSETSEQLKETLDNICSKLEISKTKFFNLLQANDSTIPKYEEFRDELKNAFIVKDYFMKIFLEKLLTYINASQNLIERIDAIIKYPNEYKEILSQLIEEFGLDNYKTFVDNYNQELKQKKINGTLITPSEIVNGKNNILK